MHLIWTCFIFETVIIRTVHTDDSRPRGPKRSILPITHINPLLKQDWEKYLNHGVIKKIYFNWNSHAVLEELLPPLPPRSCEKVVLSVMSVRQSFCAGGPLWPSPLLMITQDWRPVQTCSLDDLTVQAANQCWHLVAGYWSTFGGRAGSAHPTGMLSCL